MMIIAATARTAIGRRIASMTRSSDVGACITSSTPFAPPGSLTGVWLTVVPRRAARDQARHHVARASDRALRHPRRQRALAGRRPASATWSRSCEAQIRSRFSSKSANVASDMPARDMASGSFAAASVRARLARRPHRSARGSRPRARPRDDLAHDRLGGRGEPSRGVDGDDLHAVGDDDVGRQRDAARPRAWRRESTTTSRVVRRDERRISFSRRSNPRLGWSG